MCIRDRCKIKEGKQKKLFLGNLNAKRDWGHAKDYVELQWKILQQDNPEDFVISTGRQESVRRFIELSAEKLGWGGIEWEGQGLNEIGRRCDTNKVVVRVDKRYFRPTEVDSLLGDSSKAREKLGWKPKISLEELVSEMIENDEKIALQKSILKQYGFNINSNNIDN